MKALHITDVKDFTNKLFIGDVFDSFLLNQASITTFATFSIDGRLQYDFFDTGEQELLSESARDFALWKEIKPQCFAIIRGKRAPLQFKIVLQASPRVTAALFQKNGMEFSDKEKEIFFLNLQYKNRSLLCTTGSSLNQFYTGKKPLHLWDEAVVDFFHRRQIQFEEI